jgi:hypothetical protein
MTDYQLPPREGFNGEYERQKLEYAKYVRDTSFWSRLARALQPWGTIAAVLASVVGIVISTLSFRSAEQARSAADQDRNLSRQQSLDDRQYQREQEGIKLFYDKIATLDVCMDADLGKINIFLASITRYAREITPAVDAFITQAHRACAPDARKDGDSDPASAAATNDSIYAVRDAINQAAQANDAKLAAPPSDPAGSLKGYVVYVQYKANKANAQKAREAASRLKASAPGIDQVDNVPRDDQIRIFKSAQMDAAKALKTELDRDLSRDFKIVNLENTYKNLPATNMEVWLKD